MRVFSTMFICSLAIYVRVSIHRKTKFSWLKVYKEKSTLTLYCLLPGFVEFLILLFKSFFKPKGKVFIFSVPKQYNFYGACIGGGYVFCFNGSYRGAGGHIRPK